MLDCMLSHSKAGILHGHSKNIKSHIHKSDICLSAVYLPTLSVSQEERPVFWEVIVLVILSKCVLFRTVSEIELFLCTVLCTDEQHAMSSPELQSALMLTVEFSKMYYTR
jgi:hypothetical protein